MAPHSRDLCSSVGTKEHPCRRWGSAFVCTGTALHAYTKTVRNSGTLLKEQPQNFLIFPAEPHGSIVGMPQIGTHVASFGSRCLPRHDNEKRDCQNCVPGSILIHKVLRQTPADSAELTPQL